MPNTTDKVKEEIHDAALKVKDVAHNEEFTCFSVLARDNEGCQGARVEWHSAPMKT